MQIKDIECSKYNNYNFYLLIIEFDNIFTKINENDKKNFLSSLLIITKKHIINLV